ncbi:MAG: MscL family protein [Candidatus Kapaibacterium sp.]|jgi:large conductance mechanosensitive channel
MIKQFKLFLTSTNALALAVGVIIGAATGKVVSAVVGDLLMPIISLILPAGDWRNAEFILKSTTDAAGKVSVTSIKYGDLAGTVIDFLVIAYIVYLIAKSFIPKVVPAATKVCPECLEVVPLAARKCKSCGSPV